jgi:hypothetical protein
MALSHHADDINAQVSALRGGRHCVAVRSRCLRLNRAMDSDSDAGVLRDLAGVSWIQILSAARADARSPTFIIITNKHGDLSRNAGSGGRRENNPLSIVRQESGRVRLPVSFEYTPIFPNLLRLITQSAATFRIPARNLGM